MLPAATAVDKAIRSQSRADRRERDRRNYANNADRHRVKHANRRAVEYGAPGVLTVEDVRQTLSTGHCHYCGSSDRLGIDHVIPLHAGGPNTRENIVAACLRCNASKLRSDRPGRWSQKWDACLACGSTARAHNAKGLCTTCYVASRKPNRRHLTSDAVVEIRRLYAETGLSLSAIGSRFCLHVETVRSVVTRRSWKSIP